MKIVVRVGPTTEPHEAVHTLHKRTVDVYSGIVNPVDGC